MNAWDIFRGPMGTALKQSQIIDWIWYDTLPYVSATTVNLSFFTSLPANNDKAVSNMEIAGVLAHPKAFIVRAIRCYFKLTAQAGADVASTDVNDLALLSHNGVVSFEDGNKNYGIWQPHLLPGGAGFPGSFGGAGVTLATSLNYASNGVPSTRCTYTLSQPLLIEPQINFNVAMNWSAAQTLSGNVDIQMMLDGELLRPVQ